MSHLLSDYAGAVISQDLAREPYKDSLPARSPPGYPLGYVRERVELHCSCGSVVRYSRLLVVERSSSKGRRIRPTGKSESVYDLEIVEVKVVGGTARCDECVNLTPREVVPAVADVVRRKKPEQQELSLDDFKDIDLGDI